MKITGFAAIFVFWLAAMSWLMLTKIFPILDTAPAPLPGFAQAAPGDVEDACWDILCLDKSIGYASSHIMVQEAGAVIVTSSVRLQAIPVGELMSDLLSSWSLLARWASPIPQETTVSLATDTVMEFSGGQLERFTSTVDADNLGPMFRLEGEREAAGLRVTVLPEQLLLASGMRQPLFSSVLPIPKNAMVVDAFSPLSRMTNLSVGKRWQMRSYRAFPPNQPIRLIDACVERTEMILWDGEIVTCFVVSFTDGESGAPTAAVAPAGLMWVNDNGMVLRQNIHVGGVELDFVRKPSAFCASRAAREARP